jgi:hypothetical protein
MTEAPGSGRRARRFRGFYKPNMHLEHSGGIKKVLAHGKNGREQTAHQRVPAEYWTACGRAERSGLCGRLEMNPEGIPRNVRAGILSFKQRLSARFFYPFNAYREKSRAPAAPAIARLTPAPGAGIINPYGLTAMLQGNERDMKMSVGGETPQNDRTSVRVESRPRGP